MDFRALPSGPITLANVTVPAHLLGQAGDLTTTDLHIADGRLTDQPGTQVDMARAMVLPAFVDMHTHLDKGHIWPRASNPDGSFLGALSTVRADHANWSAEDLRARMTFSLRCAYAHGTRAVRTHLDSIPPQPQISWPVFSEIRAEWAGKIDLQAVCLIGCDGFSEDGPFRDTADLVAQHKGTLGMVSYPVPDLKDRLLGFFRMAEARGLAADFHVDETMDPGSETLRMIAETVLETGFTAPVTVGHCCSLSTQDEGRALNTLDLVAKAGINVVSLPMCNLYLQDRGPGTPRGRGVTLVHEMRDRGIPVAFASDNTRDPFYAYGDLDMLEVMRQATRIAHLDHSRADWCDAFAATPASACGFAAAGLAPGDPADLVIFKAREWTELYARPQHDRIVLRAGQAIDRTLPDYAELDPIVRPS
ncbi:amidohydrolase [Jannaschia pagri]|uniref:Amidohydrolase n=1 Tax=Jannaschia pagri TaxID=2829797 RepID=A0ABQ4NMA0_9RHOB|nr:MULTISPECIES: cytosine deaminase [unclassified Jannaschia]GIT91690.1 amidohydrolase [Jannaschia sp. AI_61]GIT95524.1 amidohydrolase [Jannaschia sp. AI_62]